MAKIDSRGRVIHKKEEPKQEPVQEAKSGGRLGRVEPIDLPWAFGARPPDLDFVIDGFLAGTVGALVAPGATGKSYLALEIAMAVASGGIADPLGIKPSKGGKVLYIAGEDPDVVLNRRIHAIGQHLGPDARQAVCDALDIRCTMGLRFDIMTDAQDLLEIVMPPEEEASDESGEPTKPKASEYRLIILDTLSRIHKLDENSNGDMSKLLGMLEYIAKQTSASVLVLHHTSKAAVRDGQIDGQQAARGASALIDNSRWCGYVARMTKEEASARGIDDLQRAFYVRYGISKQNYSEPIKDRWLKRGEGGVLLPTELPEPKAKHKKEADEVKTEPQKQSYNYAAVTEGTTSRKYPVGIYGEEKWDED